MAAITCMVTQCGQDRKTKTMEQGLRGPLVLPTAPTSPPPLPSLPVCNCPAGSPSFPLELFLLSEPFQAPLPPPGQLLFVPQDALQSLPPGSLLGLLQRYMRYPRIACAQTPHLCNGDKNSTSAVKIMKLTHTKCLHPGNTSSAHNKPLVSTY